MKISFVYPMFNESGNIEGVIRATDALAKVLPLEDYEIVVVDDCSTDGSGALADNLRSEFPALRVFHHDRNQQLGGALRTGFAAARLDHILYMDSDFPVAFADVENVLRQSRGPVDMLVGYRVGRAEGVYRQFQSWAYNALLRCLFDLPVRDANFAFKLFRREVVAESLCSSSSFIDAELLLEARQRGYDIRQVGFRYHVRKFGKSTMGGVSVIPRLLRDLVRYRRERWRKPIARPRYVIFNADDFGLCASINAGVIASHRRGVVRSASIVVTGEAFEEAAAYSRENPSLDLGLHLALCEGRPVCEPARVPSLVGPDGRFHKNYVAFVRRYFCGKISLRDVETEFRAQLQKAFAAGLRLSHLDSHQHLHALPAVFNIVLQLAEEHGIRAVRSPLERSTLLNVRFKRTMERLALGGVFRVARRRLVRSTIRTADHFLGVMHAGRWNHENLCAAVRGLPPGLTEICCHPRCEPVTDQAYDWSYRFHEELEALTSERLRRDLQEQNVRVTIFDEYF